MLLGVIGSIRFISVAVMAPIARPDFRTTLMDDKSMATTGWSIN